MKSEAPQGIPDPDEWVLSLVEQDFYERIEVQRNYRLITIPEHFREINRRAGKRLDGEPDRISEEQYFLALFWVTWDDARNDRTLRTAILEYPDGRFYEKILPIAEHFDLFKGRMGIDDFITGERMRLAGFSSGHRGEGPFKDPIDPFQSLF